MTQCPQCRSNTTQSSEIRSYHCSDATNIAPDSLCPQPKPMNNITVCNISACPIYEWVPSAWQQCNVECGTGSRHRQIECKNIIDNLAVNASHCNTGLRPDDTQVCYMPLCSGYQWVTSAWSVCSIACRLTQQSSNGTSNRTLLDRFRSDNTTIPNPIPVDDSFCKDIVHPALQRECATPLCETYVFKCYADYNASNDLVSCDDPSVWSGCSVGCGSGIQRRLPVCINNLVK